MREWADEWGITRGDYDQMRVEWELNDIAHRRKALRALWGSTIVGLNYCSGRGDDWTFWRAVRASIGIIFDLHWTDRHCERYRARHGCYYVPSVDMAFWDAGRNCWGYEGMTCWLYPGCRVSVFSDGD